MAYKNPTFAPTDHYHAEWWSQRNRNGGAVAFRHVAAIVMPSGEILISEKKCYYNRTWECYAGDSVRHALAEKCRTLPNIMKDPELAKIVEDLSESKPTEPVSCDRGTSVGYSLSMCCPM